MKVSLIVDLAGNLQSRARQYAQALTGLSNSGSRAFSGLRNAAASGEPCRSEAMSKRMGYLSPEIRMNESTLFLHCTQTG